MFSSASLSSHNLQSSRIKTTPPIPSLVQLFHVSFHKLSTIKMFSISHPLLSANHSQSQQAQAAAGSARHEDLLLKARARALLSVAENMPSSTPIGSSSNSLISSFPLASRAALLGASLANGTLGSALQNNFSAAQGNDSRNDELIEMLIKSALMSTMKPSAPAPAAPAPAPLQAPGSNMFPPTQSLESQMQYLSPALAPPTLSALHRRTVTPPAPAFSFVKPAAKRKPRYSIAQEIRKRTAVSMLRVRETTPSVSSSGTSSGASTPDSSRPMKKRRIKYLLEAATSSLYVNTKASFPLPVLALQQQQQPKKKAVLGPKAFQEKWNNASRRALSSKTTMTAKQQKAFARELFQRSLGKTL